VVYLLIAAVAATVFFATLFVRERNLNRRQQAIRSLLDGADALEAQLQACRERMQRLREMLSILPEEMSARADNALHADAKVQAALKDLLAHRLWIQQHAETAPIEQFAIARDALTQSGTTLSALLRRLDDASSDLERAQITAREAGRRTNG
jgi:predicted nuclease with TOPRIM domain